MNRQPDPNPARSEVSTDSLLKEAEKAGEVGLLEGLAGRESEQSLKALICVVEVELQALARKMRRGFSPPPSLETVELVGEMYIRIFDGKIPEIRDRGHFFSVAARTMRWILIGRHRKLKPEILEGLMPSLGQSTSDLDLEALDIALEELAAKKPDLARLVELNYFLGIAPLEIAELLGASERTVFRDLRRARGWLFWRLGDNQPGTEGSP
jgi:RNA polymerase sigma factor (TIGR02999 family)